jgi:hypothetical protein
MPRVAFLIAASPNVAFYSQIAALSAGLRRLDWAKWVPSVHVFMGGDRTKDPVAEWHPFLRNVEISWTPSWRYRRDGDWAQSDDVFRCAPRDADVLVALDADTYPVDTLESVIERVHAVGAVAGVLAHYPTILPLADRTTDGARPDLRGAWERLAYGLISAPLDFAFTHTLVESDWPAANRYTPFYLNFGMVAFSRDAFDRIAPLYLELRPRVMARMGDGDFSGQAALTLAIAEAQCRTWALPLRYNFPNDPLAESMYPAELSQIVLVHYLRTAVIDRHRIFATPSEYRAFVSCPLGGANRVLQDAVIATFGRDYPFSGPGVRHT